MEPGKGNCATCAKLIRLCGGCDFFPADIEVRRLLVERLHRLARNHGHADAMIRHWLDTRTAAPKVCDLVGLAAEVSSVIEMAAPPESCDLCRDHPGWRLTLTVVSRNVDGSERKESAMARCTCALGRRFRQLDEDRAQRRAA